MQFTELIIDQHYPGFNPTQFGCQACAPGWGYGPAVRPYWLLHYILSGSGRLHRDGAVYTVEQGQLFVIPPYTEAYYQADERDPWEYTWVGFSADNIPGSVLSPAVIHCPGADRIFRDMHRCRAMENGKSAFLCSKIWELLSLLIDSDATPSDHIDKALSYIHAQYDRGITVADVAASLHLDRTYFATLFKKRIGMSPMEYLTNLRLQQAAQLISHYEKSPTVAALSVGYGDYCHFSKAFKRHFRCSPRVYQKRAVKACRQEENGSKQ